jgi:hypothetical protein
MKTDCLFISLYQKMPRPAKRSRLKLSLGDEVKLIRKQESLPKLSQRELSDKFKIVKSTVGDII